MIRLDIRNDRTGDPKIGNYDVELWLPDGHWDVRRARVEGFPRSLGWEELVRHAVNALRPEDSNG